MKTKAKGQDKDTWYIVKNKDTYKVKDKRQDNCIVKREISTGIFILSLNQHITKPFIHFQRSWIFGEAAVVLPSVLPCGS